MHTKLFLVLFIAITVFLSNPACAETDRPAADTQGEEAIVELPWSQIVSKPSFAPLQKTFAKSGLRKAVAVAEIDYDAEGNVLAVRLSRASGNANIDREILDFCNKLKLEAGKAGTGKLPFELEVR